MLLSFPHFPSFHRDAMPERHGPPATARTFRAVVDDVSGFVLATVLLVPVCLGVSAVILLLSRSDGGDGRVEATCLDRVSPGPGRSSTRASLVLKRAFDLVAAISALIVLSPVLAVIAVAIRLEDGGPVMFRQVRVGWHGAPFAIHKFRTMVVGAPSIGGTLTVGRDPRITRIGGVLRRHKLDELPQLLDIVVGHMSFVGPRPEVPELMAQHGAERVSVITSVRPGLTDDASILFRDEGTLLAAAPDPEAYYREVILPIKYGYYARYVSELGLVNDLRIIAATAILLVTGRIPAALDRRRLAIPAGFGVLVEPPPAPIGRAA